MQCSICGVFFALLESEDRKMRIKVEIKPVSPGTVSVDNVSDIRSLVKGLHIAATPTVCCLQSYYCHTFIALLYNNNNNSKQRTCIAQNKSPQMHCPGRK